MKKKNGKMGFDLLIILKRKAIKLCMEKHKPEGLGIIQSAFTASLTNYE